MTLGAGPFAADGAAVRREIAALVSALLRQAAEAEGAESARLEIVDPLARALVGSAESLAAWWAEHPELRAEQVARILMDFAWGGLGDLVRGRTWSSS